MMTGLAGSRPAAGSGTPAEAIPVRGPSVMLLAMRGRKKLSILPPLKVPVSHADTCKGSSQTASTSDVAARHPDAALHRSSDRIILSDDHLPG